MENGVGIADTSHLVEKVLENEVLESRLKGSAEVGSHVSKDSEGDEVFEEAVASEISVVYSDNVVVGRDDDVDKAWNLDVSVASNEKADGENDVEEFEEAIGVPVSLDNLKEPSASIEDERGVFVGAESVHDTTAVEVGNEGSAMEKDGRDGEENDVSISKEEDEVLEVSDITAADEKRSLKDDEVMEVDITEVDQKSRAAVDKHENGASNNVVLEGTLAHGISENGDAEEEVMLVDKESKAGDGQLVQRGESGSLQVAVSADYCDQAEKEQKEVLGLPGTGHQVDRSSENEVYIAAGFHVDRVDGAKHDLVSLGAEHEDDKKEDIKRENSESPNEDQKVRSQGLKYELGTAVSDHRLTNGKPEVSVEEGDVTSEVEKLPGYEGLVVESDAKTQESPLNYELGTAESDHHITNGKSEASVEEGDVTSEGKELPGYEDLVVECGAKTQESASDIEMERVEVSKLQPIDKLVEPPNAVVEKHGIEGATNEEVKQNTGEHSGLREIKPTADPSSSSGISENSTPPPARPAGLGRAALLLESAPRVVQQPRVNGTSSQMQNQIVEDSGNGETEENDETREKLQMIRVKFLRLAHRLGQTPHNVVVAQVLYRLGLAEQLRGRNGGRVGAFSFDRASAMAEQLEAAGQEPLDFSCTIMVLGKTGVGKSATINSIFDEVKFGTDAFHMGTKKVQDVVGTVQGIKVRIIDTPGLLPSWSDQRQNEKILLSVKRFIKKTPPDIVLYLDRLDMQSRDLGDMPLLRTITDIFGPSIWFNAIVVLTHAASAPPEGPNGSATSYDLFVTQRSHVVQQAIRQAAGDMRLMNPVSLVENHSACRKNRAGQRVLPNGQVWKPHLLLLSFASKILAEANTLLKLQDSPPGKPFTTRTRAPPLPFLLSSLLQSRPQLKLPEEQFGDDDILDDDLDESSDSDDESEYDELPPFKRLTKAQLGKLTKDQKKAYFAELEYREKLFMKKQLKEEKRRRKMMKKMAASANELPSDYTDNAEEDSGGTASVPVPMPDLALPASFDSDNPTHRYRYLDSPNQWVVRPVLDTHGWDHDIGYEGVNVERLFVVKQQVPVSFSGQITKDKKDANLQMEIASSLKHGEGKATSLGLDMQTLGKDIAYTLRSETKFSNYKKNKATAGLSVTMLGDTFTAGVKIEDKLIVNKRLRVVASGGAMTGRGDVAYGGSFEATLRDKDHPLGRSLSTLGLSVMDWHGDLAIGGNLQSQIPVGRSTNLIARANLNNRGSGQVSIRLNSSEQLQIVLVGLIPLLRKVLGYPQESQFGQ